MSKPADIALAGAAAAERGAGAARAAPLLLKARDLAAWAASAVLLLAFWDWYVARYDVSPAVFPAPRDVWDSLWVNLKDGTFIRDLNITLKEVLFGFSIGSAIGFAFALLIAEFRVARVLLYPYVIGAQTIPKIALAPMFLIWFGFGIESKVALVIMTTVFPVLVNSLAGIERTDPDQLDMLRAYCGRRWRVFLRVKLPNALPSVFAGLQLAIVLAMISAVVSEFLGSVGGLGYRILIFNTNLHMAGEFAALIVLSVTGFTLHATVKYIGYRVVFWGRARDRGPGV